MMPGTLWLTHETIMPGGRNQTQKYHTFYDSIYIECPQKANLH